MSYDIKLGKNHDIDLVNFDFVGGAQRVAQQVKVTLLTFQGEWFLDETFGVPYFDKILVKNPNRAGIEAILRTKVKDVPDVAAVPTISLMMDHPARKLRTSIEVDTDEGIEKIKVEV